MFALSRAPGIFHVQIKFKAANVLPCKFVDVGISISLMNHKLTYFSVLSLKLLLLMHLYITIITK